MIIQKGWSRSENYGPSLYITHPKPHNSREGENECGDFSKISFRELPRVENLQSFFSSLSSARLDDDSSVGWKDFDYQLPSLTRDGGIAVEPPSLSIENKLETLREEQWSRDPILRIMLKIFMGEEVTPQEASLSDQDRCVLLLILRQKFGLPSDFGQNQSFTIALNSLRDIHSKKRKEENRKYVFKRVSKVLRAQFCAQRLGSRRPNKQTIDEEFFHFYFAELAAKMRRPLREFYFPGSCTSKIGLSKTFTTAYINLIKQSPIFRSDFERELLKLVSSNTRRLVEAKILRMAPKIDRLRQRIHLCKEASYSLIDRKGKLPWTLSEINTAYKCVLLSFSDKSINVSLP